MMVDLDLTSLQFSFVSTTVFFVIFGLMQVPAGLIIDKLGLKRSLFFACLVCTLSSTGFAFAESFYVAVVYRFFMGLGSAFAFLGLLISVHDWMPHRYSAIFIGLSQFIGTLGPMLAAGPLDAMVQEGAVDWHLVFIILGFVGAGLCVLILLFVQNRVRQSGEYTILRRPEKWTVALSRLFQRGQPWVIAFLSASLYFSIEYLSENEGRAFMSLKGMDMASAGYMLTLAWLAYAIACPGLGLLSDGWSRRKPPMVLCAFLGFFSMLSILYLPGQAHMPIAFFCLGISAAGQSIGFATMAEQFKPQFVAVGFGLCNGMITILSAVNAPVIGYLLDQRSEGGRHVLLDYQIVLSILAVTGLASVILSVFFLKETFCKSSVDSTPLQPRP